MKAEINECQLWVIHLFYLPFLEWILDPFPTKRQFHKPQRLEATCPLPLALRSHTTHSWLVGSISQPKLLRTLSVPRDLGIGTHVGMDKTELTRLSLSLPFPLISIYLYTLYMRVRAWFSQVEWLNVK